MHILFLTDNFPPEVNAPASRTFDHCRYWVKQGCSVTVITSAPNFPTGKVHEGYRNAFYQVEYVEGIRVVRVWTIISSNEGFLMRIVDYISFMISAIIASFFVKKVDIIIGTSPQFFTICAARVVSLFRRKPWVLELRDIWPESIITVGAMKRGIAISTLEWLERALYRAADHIVVVTRSFVDRVVEKGANPATISIVTNGVDLSGTSRRDSTKLRADLGLDGAFVVGYIGTHGMAHALETLLDAAAILQDRQGCDRVRFLFVGDGARKQHLQDYAARHGIGNVLFVSSVPKGEVTAYLSLLDASIVHLLKSDLFEAVIPSKIFESMALGIPIVMGVRGEALDIVERAGAGIGFEQENPVALADVIVSLQNDEALQRRLHDAGVRAAVEYDRGHLACEMLATIREVAGKA